MNFTWKKSGKFLYFSYLCFINVISSRVNPRIFKWRFKSLTDKVTNSSSEIPQLILDGDNGRVSRLFCIIFELFIKVLLCCWQFKVSKHTKWFLPQNASSWWDFWLYHRKTLQLLTKKKFFLLLETKIMYQNIWKKQSLWSMKKIFLYKLKCKS